MHRALLTSVLVFGGFPLAAVAGGDFAEGIVKDFSGGNGRYSFRFVQSPDTRPLLKQGCREFAVAVSHARVPWFSWLPFVHSSHPSKAQTEAAALTLGQSAARSSTVRLGYMGHGLVPTGVACSFRAKGLALRTEGKHPVVLAYHGKT